MVFVSIHGFRIRKPGKPGLKTRDQETMKRCVAKLWIAARASQPERATAAR